MKISDELRRLAHAGSLSPFPVIELRHIADRIDTETVELPKDRDGKPYSTSGDAERVWDNDGNEYCVDRLEYTGGDAPWDVVATNAKTGYQDAYTPDWFTHERPDSWERIADELEEWSEDNRVNGNGEVFDRALQFSDRIRRLAERED